jgi:hypothetical protein
MFLNLRFQIVSKNSWTQTTAPQKVEDYEKIMNPNVQVPLDEHRY